MYTIAERDEDMQNEKNTLHCEEVRGQRSNWAQIRKAPSSDAVKETTEDANTSSLMQQCKMLFAVIMFFV